MMKSYVAWKTGGGVCKSSQAAGGCGGVCDTHADDGTESNKKIKTEGFNHFISHRFESSQAEQQKQQKASGSGSSLSIGSSGTGGVGGGSNGARKKGKQAYFFNPFL
jgi:hypothetical protein